MSRVIRATLARIRAGLARFCAVLRWLGGPVGDADADYRHVERRFNMAQADDRARARDTGSR